MKTVTGCNQFQSQSCCKETVPDGTFWTMLGDCVPQIAGFEGQRCRESWHQPWPERQMSCQEVVRVRGGRVPGGDDRCTGFSLSFMMTVMEIMMMGRETLAWHLGTLSSHSRQE